MFALIQDPIPACAGLGGGYSNTNPKCTEGTQFPAPAEGLEGFGEIASAPGTPTFLFSIVDRLQVPDDLAPGEYVLSFRWECEQTPQIWNTCASIIIL